jgi:hypothetical protein
MRQVSKYIQLLDGEIVDQGTSSLTDALESLAQLPECDASSLSDEQVPPCLGLRDENGAFIEFTKYLGGPRWQLRVDGYENDIAEYPLVEVPPDQAPGIIEDFFSGRPLRLADKAVITQDDTGPEGIKGGSCPNCGAAVSPEAAFCTSCGARLK